MRLERVSGGVRRMLGIENMKLVSYYILQDNRIWLKKSGGIYKINRKHGIESK